MTAPTYPSTIRPYTQRFNAYRRSHPCLACGLPATTTITPPESVTIINNPTIAPFCSLCAPTIHRILNTSLTFEDLLYGKTVDINEPTLKHHIREGTFSPDTAALRAAFSYTTYLSTFPPDTQSQLYPNSTSFYADLPPYRPVGRPRGAADKPTSPRGKRTTERLIEKYNLTSPASPTPSPFSYPGGYAAHIDSLTKQNLPEPMKMAEPMEIDDGADD